MIIKSSLSILPRIIIEYIFESGKKNRFDKNLIISFFHISQQADAQFSGFYDQCQNHYFSKKNSYELYDLIIEFKIRYNEICIFNACDINLSQCLNIEMMFSVL